MLGPNKQLNFIEKMCYGVPLESILFIKNCLLSSFQNFNHKKNASFCLVQLCTTNYKVPKFDLEIRCCSFFLS